MIKWLLELIFPPDPAQLALILLERDVYHVSDDAVGLYHILPTYVREVNRILGSKEYSLDDRKLASRSREMVLIFLGHHIRRYTVKHGEPPSALRCCEMHNTGGAFGRSNPEYTKRLEKLR